MDAKKPPVCSVLVFQFHVVELGPYKPGNAALLSARGSLPFKGARPGDFPSAVQVNFAAVSEAECL